MRTVFSSAVIRVVTEDNEVIKSSPDFPQKVSEADRVRMIDKMLADFEGFAMYEGASVTTAGNLRTYRTQDGAWHLHIYRTRGPLPPSAAGDTVIADVELSDEQRADLRKRGVHWLDLRGKTRSEGGSALTEELATFLYRYGIRLPRD